MAKKSRIIVGVILYLLTLLNIPFANALVSQADIDAVQKGAEFYQQGCNTNEAANGQNNLQVSAVGDSLLVGAYAAGLNNKFAAKGYALADTDNTWPSGKVGRNVQGGIEIIKSNTEKIKNSGTILIELGTNNGAGLLQDNAKLVDDLIGAIKDTNATGKVFWVIPFKKGAAELNKQMAETLNAKAQSLQFTTIDWPDYAREENMAFDTELNVHPNDYNKYADFLVNSITNRTTSLSIQGACRCNSLTGDGTLPDSIPAPYHDIFIAAASKFGVEPAAIVALKTKETSSNYPEINDNGDSKDKNVWGFRADTVGGQWEAAYLSEGSVNVGKTGSAGPFQFLFGTWKSQSEAAKNDGNGDGRYDAENVTDAAFGAARFLSEVGGTKGANEFQMQLAFTKYNAGPAKSEVTEYGLSAYKIYQEVISFGGTAIQGTGGSSVCNTSQGVSTEGFFFPLNVRKSVITNNNPRWCETRPVSCHHDYNAADIFAPTGTIVLAARGGTVRKVAYSSRGHRIHIESDDGNLYFYTHMLQNSPIEFGIQVGSKVMAGQKIGRVGTNAESEGTPSHLHIDALPLSYLGGGLRPGCKNKASDSGDQPVCSDLPFQDLQPALVASFNNLQP